MSDTPAARAERRAEIERVLARYPHLTPAAIAELTTYFEGEASALDVGLIASNDAVAGPYRQFRAQHLDPLRPRDWLRAVLYAALTCVVLIGILWRAF